MDFKKYLEERKKKENNKCQELKSNIEMLIEEGFKTRGEILGIVMDYYGMTKNSRNFGKFISCFNRIMKDLEGGDEEGVW